MLIVQVLAGLLNPTSGTLYVKKPKSFVFQNPDHQVSSSLENAYVCTDMHTHGYLSLRPLYCWVRLGGYGYGQKGLAI